MAGTAPLQRKASSRAASAAAPSANRAATPRYSAPAVASWAIRGLIWPTVPEPEAAELLALSYQLDRTQWWPESRLRAAQFEQLQHLLAHAARTVPFYRERLESAGCRPEEPLTQQVWEALPILTRKQVQELGPQLHSNDAPRSHGEIVRMATSGSTGTPVVTLKTALAQKYYNAAALRELVWHRRDVSGKIAVIRSYRAGSPSTEAHQRYDSWGLPASILFRTGPCVTFDIFAEPSRQAQWLIDEAPDYLLSMPSNLRLLANHARSHGIQLPPLKEVRSYGEAFDSDFPKLCRELWNAKHTSVYSTQEIGIIATQCPKRPHFHCDAELALVEVLDDAGRTCRPGEVGRVVVTPLHNFAMPLIRYELGDLAEVGEPCPCGRGLPVLRRVLGRTRSLLTLPSGARRFFGSVGGAFSQFPAIVQYQIVQKSPVDIEVALVARRHLTGAEENRLRSTLARKIDEGLHFRIVYVDALPRNREGKYEDFRSEIVAA